MTAPSLLAAPPSPQAGNNVTPPSLATNRCLERLSRSGLTSRFIAITLPAPLPVFMFSDPVFVDFSSC